MLPLKLFLKMKSLFLFFGIFLSTLFTPDISDVREQYRWAADNQEKAVELNKTLSSVTEDDKAVLIAYKGAASTIMAKYAKGIKAKKTYFKEGRRLIELAIALAPKNTELRYIRLSVQENAPKIVGYKKQMAEDKQFILDNYKNMANSEVRKFIKGFVSQSTSFSEAEKQMF